MARMYKLTTQTMTTHNNTKWEFGVTVRATEPGTKMCTNQVLHCYEHHWLAIVLNPHHANIKNPRLFAIECSKIVNSDKLKFACKEQTIVEELAIPKITLTQKVAFAILCVKAVYKNPIWLSWADNWLTGTNRTYKTASNISDTIIAAGSNSAVDYVDYVAYAAAYAAIDAVDYAIDYAIDAAVAVAVDSAVDSGKSINLLEIYEQAMKY